MKIYNQNIRFPTPTFVRLIGGHPAAGPLLTQGVVIDTIDDSHEPYYQCLISGDPRAVYPYTESRHRILSQSQLSRGTEIDQRAATNTLIDQLFSNLIT